MNFLFFFFFVPVVILLLLLVWALRNSRNRPAPGVGPASFEEAGRCHVTYLPQIRQALAPADFTFLASQGGKSLARRMRKERCHIALTYLFALRGDFTKLLRLARVIAVLSPEVGAAEEFERLRLQVQFSWRYQMIRARLLLGLAPLPQLHGLGQMVGTLGIRLESAMKELGERAAVATKLASSLDRSGMHLS